MEKYLIIALTLLATSLPSDGYGTTSITIGYQASLSPQSQPSPILDKIREICSLAKLDCHLTRYPLKRGAHLLKSGLIDALITIDDQQFRHCCSSSLWTTPAFYGIYGHQNTIHMPRHEQDLIGHSLIVIRGSQTCKISFPNLNTLQQHGQVTVYEANDRDSAVRMFKNGRADYFWGISDIENDLKREGGVYSINFLPYLTRPVAVWFHKSKPVVLHKFDLAFETLIRKYKTLIK